MMTIVERYLTILNMIIPCKTLQWAKEDQHDFDQYEDPDVDEGEKVNLEDGLDGAPT